MTAARRRQAETAAASICGLALPDMSQSANVSTLRKRPPTIHTRRMLVGPTTAQLQIHIRMVRSRTSS
jgi:hypothetical protein